MNSKPTKDTSHATGTGGGTIICGRLHPNFHKPSRASLARSLIDAHQEGIAKLFDRVAYQKN